MSLFRASLRRLASHAPRQPSMKFPDRKAPHSPHGPTPHPCAPSSIVSSSSFLSSLSSSSSSSHGSDAASPDVRASPSDTPLSGSAGGSAPGAAFESSTPSADYEEWNLPSWLDRGRYAPSEEEVEAVLSGGATVSTEVTKAYKKKWYTAQI